MDLPWERHKPTIRDLYLVKDMTRKDVMKEMGERHQFIADAGQYERQFKKWGFRKNLAPNEWQFVSRRIEKRKREGKDTDLRIDGVAIPEKKLRKAITRYGQGSTLEKLTYELKQATNCRSPTPEGLCFSPPTLSSTMSVDLTALPWCRFSTTATMSLPMQIPGSGTIIPHKMQIAFQKNFKAFVPNFDGNVSKPYQGFSEGSDLDIFMISTFFASNHIQTSYRPSHELVHNDTTGSAVTRLLQTPDAFQTLQRLKMECDPTVDALCEVMFKEALQSCNLDLVRMLLRRLNIEVDEILPGPWDFSRNRYPDCYHLGRRPLQAAIESRDVRIVQLLLKHGADSNLTGTSGEDMLTLAAKHGTEAIVLVLLETFKGSVAPAFMACLHRDLPLSAEILWDRLGRSALVPDQLKSKALPAAARAGSIAIVQDLLDHGVDVNSRNDMNLSALQMAMLTRQMDLKMVKLLIDSGADVNDRLDEDGRRMPTALQFAICNNCYDAAAHLIAEGADVNAECGNIELRDLAGESCMRRLLRDAGVFDITGNALEVAIRYKQDPRLIRLLLEHGAYVDDATMARAIKQFNSSVVRLLLDFGAPYSPRVLFAAARARNVEMVRHCLEIGIDVNYRDHGNTALTKAISGFYQNYPGLLETLSLLLDYGADINLPGKKHTALGLAIEKYDEDLIEYLLSRGARCDEDVIFCAALYRSKPAVLEKLLSRALACPEFLLGYVTSCTGHPALFKLFCAELSQAETKEKAKILLQSDINLTTPCAAMALQKACSSENLDVSLIEALVLAGTPVDFPDTGEGFPCWSEIYLDDQRQPLQILAEIGCDEAVCLLLKNGADPNLYGLSVYDEYGRDEESIQRPSVLGSAVLGGHLTTVKLLLDAGSDVNQPALGRFGRTALQEAAQAGNVDILEELIGAGANVNADPAEDCGVTALQAAAIGGFVAIASRLVDLGADVNAPAAKVDGRTALEGAAEHGRIDMVQFLISAGADVESPEFGTLQYERAVELAKKQGYNAVARLLQRHRTSLG